MTLDTATAPPRPAHDTHDAHAIDLSGMKQPYHLVDPSPWPLIGAAAGGMTLFGIVEWAHEISKIPCRIRLIIFQRQADTCFLEF